MDEIPAHPVRMIFSARGTTDVIAASICPSRDEVGRTFPFASYVVIRDGASIAPFSALPVAVHPFLDSCEVLVGELPFRTLAEIKQRLLTLEPPSATQWSSALTICQRTLASGSVSEFQSRLFTDSGQPLYAYQTLLEASDSVRDGIPERTHAVLDCPIAIDVDLFVWLELARRALRWKTEVPSFFWIEEPSPRFLLSLGPPPPSLLSWLRHPERDHSLLWPMISRKEGALERARVSVAAFLAPMVETSTATLEQLCHHLETRGL